MDDIRFAPVGRFIPVFTRLERFAKSGFPLLVSPSHCLSFPDVSPGYHFDEANQHHAKANTYGVREFFRFLHPRDLWKGDIRVH